MFAGILAGIASAAFLYALLPKLCAGYLSSQRGSKLIKYGCRDMAKEVDDMRKILFPACLAIVVLAACLASAALSSPNLDISQKSASAKAGSFASSSVSYFVPSINMVAIDTREAASGNSMPVSLTVSATLFSDSNQTEEAICGLDRSNFEIDTLEVPPGGKAARIMSVSPAHANFMSSTPCSYWISIIPVADYLNQGSPTSTPPGKQNTWVNGVYTLRLRYMIGGSENAGKTFSFTIGAGASLNEAAKFNNIAAINPKLSPRDIDPINQLNPQPEPPLPSSPSI